MALKLFIASGGRIKRTEWFGSCFKDLEVLFYDLYYTSEGLRVPTRRLPRSSYQLSDQRFGVFYEHFDVSEIFDGALVEVCDPDLFEASAGSSQHAHYTLHALPAEPSGLEYDSRMSQLQQSNSDKDMDRENRAHSSRSLRRLSPPSWRSELAIFRERLWLLLDDPLSSPVAGYVTLALAFTIFISTASFIVQTLPECFELHPAKSSPFVILETVCIIIFTIELVLRLSCCPSIKEYFKSSMNIVDVVAILPFYLVLFLQTIEIPGLAVFRVCRLVRTFRLLKVILPLSRRARFTRRRTRWQS